MSEQWKMICRLKDMPMAGARMVQRGLAWQDLPGVALFRAVDDTVYALLDTVPRQPPLHHARARQRHVLQAANHFPLFRHRKLPRERYTLA